MKQVKKVVSAVIGAALFIGAIWLQNSIDNDRTRDGFLKKKYNDSLNHAAR